MSQDNNLLIWEIAHLYHEKGLSQQAIGTRFGISRMTVSRLLQQARQLEIVRIHIRAPFRFKERLQSRLCRDFGLKRALVVAVRRECLRTELGRVAALWLLSGLTEGAIIGVSVGITLARMIASISPRASSGVRVVQLMGGFGSAREYNAFNIVQELSQRLGADGVYFTSAAVVPDSQAKEQMLSSAPSDLWERCQRAFFGIGPVHGSIYEKTGALSKAQIEGLERTGAAGDVVGHYFDLKGGLIQSPAEDRIVSIPINVLRKIPEKTAIAGGIEKRDALMATLRSGLVDVLITDETTARGILDSRTR